MWIRKVDLKRERSRVEGFLSRFGLGLDFDVEYSAVAMEEDRIVGTCSFAGRVLKCFAVDEELQGEGVASKLITHITDVLFSRGILDTFIFTKPSNKGIFEGLNYKEVHSTGKVALLEGGTSNVREYVRKMFIESGLSEVGKAALVMNCNPFTLGHRHLIEMASRENKEVVVFIVEEDCSLFPFEIRLRLVREGVKDMKNVHVIPGGRYIISSNTFPSYFLRQEDSRLLEYTRLDAGIFGRYIAPAFNILRRYIGTEPYCGVTNRYNHSLMEILPQYNIEVNLIDRIEIDGVPVSASRVRELVRNDKLEELERIVPQSTHDFLISREAQGIINKIKRSDTPH